MVLNHDLSKLNHLNIVGVSTSSPSTDQCSRVLYGQNKNTFSNTFIEGCFDLKCFTLCSNMFFTSYLPTTEYVFKAAASPSISRFEQLTVESNFIFFKILTL